MGTQQNQNQNTGRPQLTPKSIETHNQLDALLGTYMSLLGSISDTVIPVFGGEPVVKPNGVPASVKSMVESTLLQICSQITSIVQDSERWTVVDNAQLRALIEENYRANLQYLHAQKIAAELAAQLAARALENDTELTVEIDGPPVDPTSPPPPKKTRKKS